jgi:cell wall-associated NlpC family hydrolase
MKMQNRLTQLLVVVLLTGLVSTSCKSRKIITDASASKNKIFSGTLMDKYATALGVSKNKLENEKLYRFIDSWMGVPHRNGGTDKGGIDCSGFTALLQDEIYNRKLPRVARQMAGQVKRKYEEDLREGDLVFFDFDNKPFSHVGVFLQNNKFVHASNTKGVIISDLKDLWYYKYFSRAGSI